MTERPLLTPRLVVRDAAGAIAYYTATLGARELERYADDRGHVVHAALALGNAVIALTDEAPEWNNCAPPSLGGSPVILNLEVDDPDEVARKMVAGGGRVIFEVSDQFYGHREGRVQDPFGHLWILTKVIAKMTPEQIREAMRG
ncbi:MAG: VOC family protein [Labilithrix sp.]|nr:VOC family protein [Labilithrix sp.]MCW5812681.1 VOC family protein [Labilithrix sp.]